MILCDREIQALIEDGLFLIDPIPPKEYCTSTSLDLTLDNVVLKWEPKPTPNGSPIELRPKQANFAIQQMMEDPQYANKINLGDAGYSLNPGSFILGYTKEKLRLPIRSRIAARVEGKCSLARIGIGIHVTAPTIHAGFGAKDSTSQGTPIQLEIFNVGPWVVRLDVDMRICQLIFEEVREIPQTGYRGQFGEQQHFTA